jgi:hypothetical protein
MNWQSFEESAPELATLARARFGGAGVALLGTLRRDGWPRISPLEVFIVDGELMLGMIWRSKKALDLLRDPRLVVHSATVNREGSEGDVKLYGTAVVVTDERLRERYADTLQEVIDWRPTEPYNLFSTNIQSAAFVSFGAQGMVLTWDPVAGLRRSGPPG